MRQWAVQARFPTLLWLSTLAQAPMAGIALLFLAAQLVLGVIYPAMDVPAGNSVLLVLISTLVTVAMVLVAYVFVVMVMTERPRHPTLQLLRRIWNFLRDARAMALGLPVFVSLVVFVYAFSNVKGNIPVFQPFAWDPTLDHWDKLLHFGRRPWEWLQPLLGHWPVTFAVNVLYNLWFVVMFSVWLHYAFMSAPGIQRTRFFLAFMLLWMIGGGLFAVLLSSAGPCFYGPGYLGYTPDPYAPLMAYLHSANDIVPIWAVSIQQGLWAFHAQGSAEASVSAMPSMHNGSALLFALASAGWPRWLRRALWAYVAVIFVGSVHLGYHYAVDGYAGWALALAMWRVAGMIARRWEATAPALRFRAAFAESPASL
jgi:hypothetical protein